MRRRRRRRVAFVAAALLAAACSPPGSSGARYVVGEPYRMGGVWSYPREDSALSESGLAVVLPDGPRGRRTANGEVYDPAALVAAHRTVQLPAVVSVWNLDTGLELRVRVNDRGPESPGRVLGLSRRAAALLGVAPGEPARVRIALDPELSRAASEGLPGSEGPLLAMTAAPRAVVEREELPPPPGARAALPVAARGRPGSAPGAAPAAPIGVQGAAAARPGPTGRLPEQVTQRGAAPSRLLVDAGAFFRRDLAERRAAALGGRAEPFGPGRQPQFRVRLGPFRTVREADAALEAAFRGGVADAKIVLD